jgi:hypothetical protein
MFLSRNIHDANSRFSSGEAAPSAAFAPDNFVGMSVFVS